MARKPGAHRGRLCSVCASPHCGRIDFLLVTAMTELIVECEPYAALFNWYAAEAAEALAGTVRLTHHDARCR